jgi:hypothetical protein
MFRGSPPGKEAMKALGEKRIPNLVYSIPTQYQQRDQGTLGRSSAALVGERTLGRSPVPGAMYGEP